METAFKILQSSAIVGIIWPLGILLVRKEPMKERFKSAMLHWLIATAFFATLVGIVRIL